MTATLFIIFFVLAAGFLVVVKLLHERRVMGAAMQYALTEVRLPRHDQEKEKQQEVKSEIAVFEQLVSALERFKYPIAFEMAVHHVGEAIRFYVAGHRQELGAVMRQILAFWPKADVAPVPDYNIFNPEGETAIARARLAKSFVLPIRSYELLESDPLATISNALSSLKEEGEGAAVQVIFSRAGRERKIVEAVAKRMREGKSLEEAAFHGGAASFLKTLGEIAHPEKAKEEKEKPPPQPDTESQKVLERKLRKPLVYANLRAVASAQDRGRAEAILREIQASFYQFHDPDANKIEWVNLEGRAKERAVFNFSFRNFRPEEAMVLTTDELASLIHFPTHLVETPKIQWARAGQAPPPVNLPQEGVVIGESVFRGERRPVMITDEDRLRHVYIVGQTGTGKSALLKNMAYQDIAHGRGICFIDPHGDAAEALLGLVPEERMEDVVYFNPPDVERPMGLNMFEYDRAKPEQRTFIVNEMIEIFHKLWEKIPEAFGPMFEQYMRNSMLLVMGDPIVQPTLMDVPRVLADAAFRHELLSRSTNPTVVEFWTKEAEKAGGEASLANMVPYITSKLNPFIANDIMRPIIGQTASAFRPREIMDQGKILIVNLAKGVLGETNSFLLGMIIVGRMFMAALSRVDQPEAERRDFYMYLDEFQNLTTSTLAGVLSEARKYRLSLIIAHQFIAQLREDVRDAVFGNAGSTISFRIGPQDAEFLVKQFAPVFGLQDLVNIDNFNAYVKLLIRGETTPAFNVKTYPPAAGNSEIARKIQEYSRMRYGRPREEVENEIFARYRP